VELFGDLAAQYRDFAGYTRGESPCFEEWALGVAADGEVMALIGELPQVKQQPNLVLAAARWHGVPAPASYDVFRRELIAGWEAVRATILTRSTQTNEVGRLATLVPAFAAVQARKGRPLALLEIGASAGLCLYPDRYRYAWSTRSGVRTTTGPPAAPLLSCAVTGPAPLPSRPPRVDWRAGVDLNPLDVDDDDAMAWLENLVWPEQDERRSRLRAAVAVARKNPPQVWRGDLLSTLPDLITRAPSDTTLIVFHSAVIAYLEPPQREDFHRMMTSLVAEGLCHWVSNEGQRVLPRIAVTGRVEVADDLPFVLGIDGRGVGRTHGHGSALSWWPDAS
jgi:hypothetical protein